MFIRAPLLAEKATAWYLLDKIEPKGFVWETLHPVLWGDLNLEYGGVAVASTLQMFGRLWRVMAMESVKGT